MKNSTRLVLAALCVLIALVSVSCASGDYDPSAGGTVYVSHGYHGGYGPGWGYGWGGHGGWGGYGGGYYGPRW